MKRFHRFCDSYSIYNPFPVTEPILCYFVAALASDELSPQTIKVYLSAVRDAHIALGFPDPRSQMSMCRLERIQAGIKRVAATRRKPGELLSSQDKPSRLPPQWGEVAFNRGTAPTIVRVHLKFAKCDQFGQGADVFIGQSGNAICPIAACLSYVAVRGDQPGPFFVKRDGRPMLKPDFVSELRRALTARGFDSLSFAGHSFRIGAATAAAAAGIEDSTIKALGRWSSDAFLSYIRTPGLQLAATSASIARIVDR
ncbi:hypothetical protein EMCRGX_G030412 [Ephydatia muelleri]